MIKRCFMRCSCPADVETGDVYRFLVNCLTWRVSTSGSRVSENNAMRDVFCVVQVKNSVSKVFLRDSFMWVAGGVWKNHGICGHR